MIAELRRLKKRAPRLTIGHHSGRLQRRYRRRRLPPPPVEVAAPQLSDAERLRQTEIEQELQLARDLQQGLLLEAVPQLIGWEMSAVCLPARSLGGDLYDFLTMPNDRQGIMIGDVSGKGLPAALRMAVARTVFRHAARSGAEPGLALAAVNRGILSEIPHGMVTMLYAMLDVHHGELRIANAGHNYPVLINGIVSEVEITGLPLGVDGESDYEEICAVIEPGGVVVLYTDGVVEAVNANDEMFGYERLEQILLEQPNRKPRALVAKLLHELRAWSDIGQTDDITMVVVRRRLTCLSAELRTVADDVLGEERATALWAALPLPAEDAPSAVWADVIPVLVRTAQALFGRGLARELHAQLRLALEEYR